MHQFRLTLIAIVYDWVQMLLCVCLVSSRLLRGMYLFRVLLIVIVYCVRIC